MARDPERLRALLRREGDQRRANKASNRKALDAIAELTPEAIEAGLTKSEISELSEVSRPWINELLKRRGGAP